jgi:hypothetical protein
MYAAPFRHQLDAAYTTLPDKLSSTILGLCTRYGYILDCLAKPPTDTYPSRNCTYLLHPPQTPKHLLLSCPEHRTAQETLRRDLKLGCLTRPHLSTSLQLTPSRAYHGNGDPPPAISATTTEVIDFSIEFGFAILNYVPL